MAFRIANAKHWLPLSSLFTQSLFNSKLCLLLSFFNAPQLTKASFRRCVALKKPLHFREEALYRGPERIRTAVEAFAELCLATRPQDPFGIAKITQRS